MPRVVLCFYVLSFNEILTRPSARDNPLISAVTMVSRTLISYHQTTFAKSKQVKPSERQRGANQGIASRNLIESCPQPTWMKRKTMKSYGISSKRQVIKGKGTFQTNFAKDSIKSAYRFQMNNKSKLMAEKKRVTKNLQIQKMKENPFARKSAEAAAGFGNYKSALESNQPSLVSYGKDSPKFSGSIAPGSKAAVFEGHANTIGLDCSSPEFSAPELFIDEDENLNDNWDNTQETCGGQTSTIRYNKSSNLGYLDYP
uniref:Uncharacterized protein n=1 Tax=Caenorhabditis tropicalis TaxID=1561998 RepID=A0A1I7TNX4_9PELO